MYVCQTMYVNCDQHYVKYDCVIMYVSLSMYECPAMNVWMYVWYDWMYVSYVLICMYVCYVCYACKCECYVM